MTIRSAPSPGEPAGRPVPRRPSRVVGRATWPGLAGVIVLTAIAYLPALRAGFVFDDDTYLTGNRLVQDPRGLREIWLRPTASVQYYPLVFTTYWIEHRIWGPAPLGYHLVNVALHAIGAVLLGLTLRRLAVPGAGLAAALFAVHPVHVESVAWIVERKNVLSGVLYLSAAMAYLRYVGIGPADGAARRWRWYALAVLLFLGALFSKTAVCSLPAALLLVLWWKRGRIGWFDALPLVPLFVSAAALGLTTAWLEKHHVGAEGTEFGWSFLESCLIAGRALWFYAGKLVWPVGLAFIYPQWAVDAGSPGQWLYPWAAAAVPAGLWLVRKRIGTGPLVAVLFFMGTLAPTLGFYKVYGMRYTFVADHWQYHASMAPIALAAAGLTVGLQAVVRSCGHLYQYARSYDTSQSEEPRGLKPAARRRRGIVHGHRAWTTGRCFAIRGAARHVPAAVIVIVLAVLTWRQAGVYANVETLWRDTLAKNPSAWMAHNNLGKHLMEHVGTPAAIEEAIGHFRDTIRLRPDHTLAMNNLGVALTRQRRLDEAIAQYRAALAVEPRLALAHKNLGVALADMGRQDEAIDAFRRAVELDPADPGAHRNLAIALRNRGDLEEAIAHHRFIVRTGRADPSVLNELAWLLATAPQDHLRNGEEAFRLAQSACQATGYRNAAYLATLSAACAETGRFEQGVSMTEAARQIAEADGNSALAARLAEWIPMLRAHHPIRESAASRPP